MARAASRSPRSTSTQPSSSRAWRARVRSCSSSNIRRAWTAASCASGRRWHLEKNACSHVSNGSDLQRAMAGIDEVLLGVDEDLHRLLIKAEHAQGIRASFLRISAECGGKRGRRFQKARREIDGRRIQFFGTYGLTVKERKRRIDQFASVRSVAATAAVRMRVSQVSNSASPRPPTTSARFFGTARCLGGVFRRRRPADACGSSVLMERASGSNRSKPDTAKPTISRIASVTPS